MKSVEYSGLQQHSGETSSAQARLIIHGGQSLITYSTSKVPYILYCITTYGKIQNPSHSLKFLKLSALL